MDPVLIGIATVAGGALIQAMTSDVWATSRERLAKIMGRGDRDIEAQVSQELDATAARLRERSPLSPRSIEVEQTRWADKLARLCAEHAEVAEELRDFVTNVQRRSPCGPPPQVVQHITAQRNAYIAGRDQHISINADEDEH